MYISEEAKNNIFEIVPKINGSADLNEAHISCLEYN